MPAKGEKMRTIRALPIIKGILLGLAVLIFATALGLAFIHIGGFPYSYDIENLNISENTGLSKAEIEDNYNAVMDFLVPFNTADFSLPSLKFSESGASHFVDCRNIFNVIYGLGGFSALLLLALVIFKRGKTPGIILKTSGIVTLAIPTFLGAAIAVDFQRMFILFHKVFFTNDEWLFDPNVDEIINILPEAFFMHCALVIAAFWVLAAVIQLWIGFNRNSTVSTEHF